MFREASISRSLTSSLGKALSKSFFPARSTATAWCSPLPTSRPMKTSMLSWFPITCTSQSQQLIPVLDCPRCQSPASTLRTTIPNCPASISGLSGTYRTPVTTPPGSLTTGGGNHAGAGRPAHPHPATGTGYEKGNGAGRRWGRLRYRFLKLRDLGRARTTAAPNSQKAENHHTPVDTHEHRLATVSPRRLAQVRSASSEPGMAQPVAASKRPVVPAGTGRRSRQRRGGVGRVARRAGAGSRCRPAEPRRRPGLLR